MTGQGRALLICLLVCLPGSGAGMAETLPAASPPAAAPPAAVGRIDRGPDAPPGAAICTGALVAPDLVLTAAHCLQGAGAYPAGLRFTAGGVARRGAAVLPEPEAALEAGQSGGPLAALAGDVALLRLDAPILAGVAAPMPLWRGAVAEPGAYGRFALFAFRRDRPETLSTERPCRLIVAGQRLLALDCPVVSGNSGAPLLVATTGGWAVAAVMVAANQSGPVRAWAAVPDDALRALIGAEGEGANAPE